MDPENMSHVSGSLSQSVIEFFRDYGLDCRSSDAVEGEPSLDDMEMGSIVGFKGRGVRGGLAFVAPAALVAKLLPVPTAETKVDHQLRDWSAEIANQLLGRLKNKLSSQNVDFDIGTPVCFRGTSVRLSFLPNADGVSLAFDVERGGGVRVYLDCSVAAMGAMAAKVTSSANEDFDPRIVAEGDVVLF